MYGRNGMLSFYKGTYLGIGNYVYVKVNMVKFQLNLGNCHAHVQYQYLLSIR